MNKKLTSRGPEKASRLHRYLLATFAIAFVLAGLSLQFFPPADATSGTFAAGVLLKVGVVLGLGWLAAPQLERLGWAKIRGSMLIVIILVILLYAIRPRLGAVVGGVIIAGSLLFSLIGWFRAIAKPR